MKNFSILSFVLFLSACTNPGKKRVKEPEFKLFYETRGCYLLYNLKTLKYEKEVGDACQERYPACSTFKVPLAAMAFDSKVLKDENQVLKWDGKKRMHDT